jgi:hypothetical protein
MKIMSVESWHDGCGNALHRINIGLGTFEFRQASFGVGATLQETTDAMANPYRD